MTFPTVTEGTIRRDIANLRIAYDHDQAIIEEQRRQIEQLTAERNNAASHINTLTWERDQLREALEKVNSQLEREQERTRHGLIRIAELKRQTQKLSAVIRCALSPNQWHEAHAFAKEQYPHLWKD
jgi:outer membrane protein TolC